MIFIVKDEHNEQRDRQIAKYVMNLHMNRPNVSSNENGDAFGEIDIDKMKRYIAYCKASVIINMTSTTPTYSGYVQEMRPAALCRCARNA